MFQFAAGHGLSRLVEKEHLINLRWFDNPKIHRSNESAYHSKRKPEILDFLLPFQTKIDSMPTPIDGRFERSLMKFDALRYFLKIADESDFHGGIWRNPYNIRRLAGFFMSPKYFESQFSPRELSVPVAQISPWSQQFLSLNNLQIGIGVHVRLGDYIQLGDKVIPSEEYYLSGIRAIQESKYNSLPVYIFTDEPSRLAEMFPTLCRQGVLIDHPKLNPSESLILLSMCAHFVCSNSTYSWWGAHLKEGDKQLVRPSYFYTATPNVDTNADLWAKTDIRLDPIDGRLN
jgi:hypothetical protein